MKLVNLLDRISKDDFKYKIYGKIDIDVSGISDDTRKVKKGNLFIAIKGQHFDGHKLIPEAILKGAKVIVGEAAFSRELVKGCTYLQVKNTRKVLSYLASAWFGNPAEKLKMIGITGTKGKTTTAEVVYHLLKTAGKKVGLVSTINAKIGSKVYDTGLHVTNPEPLEIQKFLSKMVKVGCEYGVLEVTSHGLDQERIAGVRFIITVLTNIVPEHLDYHKTYESYRAAKIKLFRMTDIAVLNKDDQDFNYVKKEIGSDISLVTYGVSSDADYKGVIIDRSDGTRFTVNAEKKSYELKTNLEGNYNVLNSLAAVSVVRCLNIGWPIIHRALKKVPSMSGRLEEIKNKKGMNIYIDFAHTSDSLEKVLKLLKTKTKGKLIVVFGSAGERDKEKRKKMGEVAGRLANISILTAEDPRSERVEDIIESISQGESEEGARYDKSNDFNKKGRWFIKVPERGEAIALAIQKYAHKGDTVVVCGKGHEKSMCYGTSEYPWSDHEAIDLALKGGIKVISR